MGNDLDRIADVVGRSIKYNEMQAESMRVMRNDIAKLILALDRKIDAKSGEVTRVISNAIDDSNDKFKKEIVMAIVKLHSLENDREQSIVRQAEQLEKTITSIQQWYEIDGIRILGERRKRDAEMNYDIENLLNGMSKNNTLKSTFNPDLIMKYEPCKESSPNVYQSHEITAGIGCYMIIIALLIALLYKTNSIAKTIKGKSPWYITQI